MKTEIKTMKGNVAFDNETFKMYPAYDNTEGETVINRSLEFILDDPNERNLGKLFPTYDVLPRIIELDITDVQGLIDLNCLILENEEYLQECVDLWRKEQYAYVIVDFTEVIE